MFRNISVNIIWTNAVSTAESGVMTVHAVPAGSFDFIKTIDPVHLANFISLEHPQIIALILSFFDSQKASLVFKELPQNSQVEVARRMARTGQISPEIIRTIERVLVKKFSTIHEDKISPVGSIESIVNMLNLSDRSVEKFVIESLGKIDPVLTDEIKKNMFVFEDIQIISDKDIRAAFQRAGRQDILLAIKATSEEFRGFVRKNLPDEFKKNFNEDFQSMGRIRLVEVEEAQKRIINILREMEGNGEIIVARAEDQLV